MTISRRTLIASSALALALPAASARAAAAPQRRSRTSRAHRAFIKSAEAQGAKRVAEESIVRSASANSGLSYSVNFAHPQFTPRHYVVQPAARVDDIAERGRTAVLPYFTIGGILHDVDDRAAPTASLLNGLTYLQSLGIPLSSMEFTTSEASPEMVRVVKSLGVEPKRLVVRDSDEAKAAADGSGWFVDPVTGFSTRTMSIAVHRDGKKAEVLEAADMGYVVGLERAEWARSGTMPTWDAALNNLLVDIRREAAAQGLDLPAGYEQFAATQA